MIFCFCLVNYGMFIYSLAAQVAFMKKFLFVSVLLTLTRSMARFLCEQKIPGKFVRKYGDELSCIATLIVPTGRIWVVELEKVNNKLWFRIGWPEFVEYYSIRIGYFLVFRYEGQSTFNVSIYDLTVSEIRYPCSVLDRLRESCHSNPGLVADKKHVVDNSVKEISGSVDTYHLHSNWDISGNSRDKMIQRMEHVRHSRDIGVQFNENDFTCTDKKVDSPVSGEVQGRTRRRKRRIGDPNVQVQASRKASSMKIASEALTRRWRAVTAEEKQRALRASEMFKPNNPFFRIVLKPSYVYRGFLLHVPSSFAQRYLTVSGSLTIQISDAKQWYVRCIYRDKRAKLSKGWTEFAWENNLEEGDVCVFELIQMNVLKVTIFRVLEVSAPFLRIPSKIKTELNDDGDNF
ncbi:B3 domain-containing transcription factor VRN1-like isoform X2 [Mercurialis annua]|uniref:B3 domain-containing transcription factor VRN1-like isoform X2 n=1 Tax=Mercurialis annua TaxID=3986 RepID=UPI00215F5BB8|nr:B3 domain-containing transcription factor VRN1-like isoform X2 [Mercurialis annua]